MPILTALTHRLNIIQGTTLVDVTMYLRKEIFMCSEEAKLEVRYKPSIFLHVPSLKLKSTGIHQALTDFHCFPLKTWAQFPHF